MPKFVYANFVNTTLAGAITTTTQTTITLSSSTNLPTISAGQTFVLILNDAATQAVFEIVYVTARSGATLTVIRGQEGTAASTWLVGDFAYGADSAGILGNFAPLANAGAVAIDTSATAQTKVGALNVAAFTASSAVISGAAVAASMSFSGIGSPTVPWIGTDGPTTGLQFNIPTGSTNGFRWLSNNATDAATLSITGGFEAGLLVATVSIGSFSAPALVSTGDVVAQRSGSTGAVIMGGGTASGTLDFGITTPGYLTVNEPFSVLASLEVPVSSMTGGDICATRAGSVSGVLFLGGSGGAGFFDYGLTTSGQFSCSLVSGGYATLNATAFTTHSDLRAKTAFEPLSNALAEVMALKPGKYRLIETDEPFRGFGAQDVAAHIPEAVKTNNTEQLLLHYDSIFTTLVAAFQDHVLACHH